MKKRKIVCYLMILVFVIGLLSGCSKKKDETNGVNNNDAPKAEESATSEETAEENISSEEMESVDIQSANTDITIVYTNDVHSYIDNSVTDGDGNVTGDGLRFSKIAAMVNDLREGGANVLLVDDGDEIQGDIYGAMDKGATIIKLMEATGYQLATPGNHEFDYGVKEFIELADGAQFPYVTCNFRSITSKEILFPDSYTFDIAGKKVAFVGITTPETITNSTPTFFQDETGEFIYTIDGMKNVNDLYVSVQNAVDNARKNADYVIALGHLGIGIDEERNGISSEDVISNVTGLDAFIDGHSHSTVEGQMVKDKDGKDVLLTQTGSFLAAVGVMTITEDGTITTKLVNDYEREDDTVAKLEKDWIQQVSDQLNEKIGVLDNTLYVNNPENDKQRLIRSQELNLGDFTADSMYWFLNERIEMPCDVALINAGGVRAQLEEGDLTYMSAKQVEPFGNMVCLISAKGQQIIDALEMGTTVIGEWDKEWDSPAENGGFMQVAGLTYSIDAGIPSSVKTDENGMFVSVDGEYRVKDVKVYNKEKGTYEPIDPDKEYQVGGINYILRNSGNGLSMFNGDKLIIDYVGQDYVIFAEYIKSFVVEDDFAKVNTKNSPLSAYEGYLIDYEDPNGAGRIAVQRLSYDK